MNIIFSINGGRGKSVMATAVCKAIRKKFPTDTLIVLPGYPEVFLNNQDVDFAFGHNDESYFYNKYIDKKDFVIIGQEPYLDTEHLKDKEHVIETWCKIHGIEYNREMPTINLNEREMMFFSNKYPTQKPIMVIQSHGGADNQEMKYSWARDIPYSIVNRVVEEFKNDYDIFHIRRQDQMGIENTIPVQEGIKGIASLILRSQKRLFMDSFCQHLAAALQKRSTVLWIANKPNVFGYEVHDNIIANPETIKPDLKFAGFSKYNITGNPIEFPYNSESEIFNADQIIESILAQ